MNTQAAEIEARAKAATEGHGLVESNKGLLPISDDPGYWFCRVCHHAPGTRSPEDVSHLPDCPVPAVLAELADIPYLLGKLKAVEEEARDVCCHGYMERNVGRVILRILKGGE